MSILLFVVILALLIFIHELGHFIAAKQAGIRVDEFGIGFPPRLWKKKVGETVYSLNAFPIGGFVKIFGENPDHESIHGKDKARSFVHKPKLAQVWVVSAGVVFNILLAWSFISAGFMVGLQYSADDSAYGKRVAAAELVITQVLPHSPAESAGLKSGDHIRELSAGKSVLKKPTVEDTQKFIAGHEEVSLVYARGNKVETVIVHPQDGVVSDRRAIGISMDMIGILQLPTFEALYAGAVTTASLTWATTVGIADFIKSALVGKADFSEISGPVGIVGIVGDASALGISHLISLVALISINLAVINLLPFPALDGGRLFFLMIEAIKGSPIKPVIANATNGIGFVLLIILMVVVTYHDIAKLLHG